MNECITAPPVLGERENFVIKVAEDDDEIERALRLRYEVFAAEQGRLDGGVAVHESIDRDTFDDYCMHLLVVEKPTGRVVGTYRVHPGSVARKHLGLYSEREYRIDHIDHVLDSAIEVGRSCVDRAYRNGTVVALLWAGIAELHRRMHNRYMCGCVSLEERDPALGWALYEYFRDNGRLDPVIRAVPRPGFELAPAGREKIDGYLADKRVLIHALPPLFKAYLRLGITICGKPAWDGEFGSIDFFILLNFDAMPEKYARHFGI